MGQDRISQLLVLSAIALLLAVCGCYKSRLSGDADADAFSPEATDLFDGPDRMDATDGAPDPAVDEWPDGLFDLPPPDVVTPDMVYDYTNDAELDWPSPDSGHTELPPLPYVEQCGNGLLDDGEECDDRNRLNGDGCDWQCRVGDGDPPPDPEPGVDPYVPEGDLIYMPGPSTPSVSLNRLPIQWTGSEFATAFVERLEDDSWNIRFRRFDDRGEPINADWVYRPGTTLDATDLVWTGSGFGLFFSDTTYGIYYLRLSPDGKPVSDPVIVEPDPAARAPAADLTGTGFVLAWITEGTPDIIWSWCNGWGEPLDTIRLRLVDFDGTTYGPPVMVEDMAGGPPDIVTGSGGFGLTMGFTPTREFPSCAFRFVRIDESLTDVVYSGILGNGMVGDLVWIDGHYIVGWPHFDTAVDFENSELCIAHFSAAGNLERAPTCNDVTSIVTEGNYVARMAAGDGGLALVFSSDSDQQLSYLRTGLNGRAVMPPQSVVGAMCNPYEPPPCWFGAFGTTWADHGFAVLFSGHVDDHGGIFLRHFVSAY
jgi:cysteine-rich repeat protein